MAGKTVVYDMTTKKTYVGNFTPADGLTAHAQLVQAAKLNPNDCVGLSIKPGSYIRDVGWRSETLNRPKLGNCEASDSRPFFDMSFGDYKTVSQNGSVNQGQRRWNLHW
jgi:hypothetical protein